MHYFSIIPNNSNVVTMSFCNENNVFFAVRRDNYQLFICHAHTTSNNMLFIPTSKLCKQILHDQCFVRLSWKTCVGWGRVLKTFFRSLLCWFSPYAGIQGINRKMVLDCLKWPAPNNTPILRPQCFSFWWILIGIACEQADWWTQPTEPPNPTKWNFLPMPLHHQIVLASLFTFINKTKNHPLLQMS